MTKRRRRELNQATQHQRRRERDTWRKHQRIDAPKRKYRKKIRKQVQESPIMAAGIGGLIRSLISKGNLGIGQSSSNTLRRKT